MNKVCLPFQYHHPTPSSHVGANFFVFSLKIIKKQVHQSNGNHGAKPCMPIFNPDYADLSGRATLILCKYEYGTLRNIN